MHVAFLTPEYPPLRTGGIGTSIRNLGHALTRDGHRVTVLGWGVKQTWNDGDIRVEMLGETAVPRLGWLLNRQQAAKRLNALIAREGVDIVEAPDWGGLSAGMRFDCPLVIRMNGSATYFGYLLKEPVRRSVTVAERMALHGADALCSVSRFTADVTSELFNLKQPVSIIPNGIDIDRFSPSTEASEGNDIILYFGTLVRKKGILDLCRVFSLVAARHPTARMHIVGRDAADRQTGSASTWELCRGLLSPDATRRTEYLGEQPYERVQEFVRVSSICVFPSYAEAMPLAWLEAMACGKPVIAYDIGWAAEAIECGKSGVLLPPGDELQFAEVIITLLSKSDLRMTLGKAARERVEERFSAERIGARTCEWYRRVIG